MISKDCTITIDKGNASVDEDVYLYKNDMNIQILFTIVNNKYRYTKNTAIDNIIANNKASYAQVKFKKGDIEIDFEEQETKDGAVVLLIKKELIDEDTELGDYSIQIRLFDENKTSVITLPPVENCIHIQRPLFEKAGEDTNIVDQALTDMAVVTYAEPISATNSDGTYNKKTWVAKEKITTAELNRMEDGIAYNNTQFKDIAKQTITTEERTKLTNLENYDDSSIKNDIQVQKARIDTFTSLKEGSTTGDAELMDARIGADGITYENIGGSIRNQIGNINNALYGGISSKNNINLWEQGTFHSSNLEKMDSNLFIRTKEPISKDFDNISLNANMNNVSFVVFNSDKTVKKWLKYEGEEVYFSATFKNICLFSKDLLESYKTKILDIVLNSQDYPYTHILLSNADNSAINVESYNNLNINKNVTGLTEVFQNVSNGKKLIASAITDKGINTSNIDTFQTMANNINKIEGNDKLLYKFGVVSDNHCAKAYNGQNKMVKVLNYYNNSDVDFVCSCGDITTDNIEHIDWLKSEMNTLNFSKPFYAVRGNHDVYLTNEQWKSYFGHEPNFFFNKGNDMFIFLSIDYNCNPPYKYNDAWTYLQTLDVTNKRVFLIQHLTWEGKAGVRAGEAYGFTKDDELGNNIYNYFPKNLIAFTGHSHYTFECEEQLPKYDINIYNENRLGKTVIHCPSTGYAVDKDRNKILDKDIIEGWICEVYAKKIILKAIDFNTNECIPNYIYTINTL